MREDMSKVVIERPRRGHADPNLKTGWRSRRYDPEKEYDDLPTRLTASMRSGTKNFSDLLSPLRRYLRSNVGRPWNKVWSEMKEHLDDRKTTGRHIFEHVEREVALHCYVGTDGRIYPSRSWYRDIYPVEGLYVHPRTGLLCWKEARYYKDKKRREAAVREILRIEISDARCYLKLKGLWYIGEYVAGEKPENLLHGDEAEDGTCYYSRGRWLLLKKKKQCNGEELRKAGLSNDPPQD